jgi:hypothetical protein
MKNLLPLFIVVLIFVACKKEITGTTPVEFTDTIYDSLGDYDASGKPNYLVTRDVISPNLLSFASNSLREGTDLRRSNPELLTSKAIADIVITKRSDVFITFVAQTTGASDAFAFYTYPTNNPPASAKDIKTITFVFPNAGNGTPLQAGDKAKLGRFDVGTSIGFVILQDGWNKTTKTINKNAVHFCSNDVLNPENNPDLKKHAVLINYPPENKILIGFEDLDRTSPGCDHDFNDVTLYATVSY